mgnify:FL=1
MIVDLQRFLANERPFWSELERLVDQLERDPGARLSLDQAQRFHLLFERTAADLARLRTFSSEPQTRQYLEHLVARAYGEIHETRDRQRGFRPGHWFFATLPRTFRRHLRAFWMSLAVTLAGALLGGFALALDHEAKPVLIPFPHLQQDPAQRVAQEEQATADRLAGAKTTFSALLMTHNTKVSILTLALGMSWGVGTVLMLFYNGVLLGAVAVDYVAAGQTRFLLGWLLPHGAIEIPAIVIAGQAGLVLASALIGWGSRTPLAARLRRVSGDIVTLIAGVALLLVWAGLVEAFLSQYHEPIIPYTAKIAFGVLELAVLIFFLARSGTLRRGRGPGDANHVRDGERATPQTALG